MQYTQDRRNTVKIEQIDKMLIITLNRPDSLNAVNKEMTYEMDECLRYAEQNSNVGAIIITGAGRAFCAGVDLKERSRNKNSYRNPPSGFAGVTKANLTKPIISAVNGIAYGGGMEIALASDIVIASDTAQFALPEVTRGIIASGGGLLRLPRQIPLKFATMMALTGEAVTAKEMERWGMVNQVVSDDNLLSATLEVTKKITSNAPLAVQASKQLLLEGMDLPLHHSDQAWELNKSIKERIGNSEDAKEGPKAFAEKRSPKWSGR